MRFAAAWTGVVALAACGFAAPSVSAASQRDAVGCALGDCDIPWAWDDDRLPPPENPPYPQGFVLTVQVPPDGRATGNGERPLSRYPQIAEALGRCWDPSAVVGDRHWGAITVRVSFKRNGSVNGVPRITYVDRLADKSVDADLRRSLLAALARCAPLPFSGSLGGAVAGQIFTIRFVQKGNQA